MLSVPSGYLGQVVASDSKREYLCSIVGSCLWFPREVTEISSVVDVLLLLGRKQRSLVHGTCGLFTLHTLLKAVVCCLQLNTGGGSDDNLKVDFDDILRTAC